MSIDRAELQDSARKAFGADGLAPDADKSWNLLCEMGWLMMTVPEAHGGLGLGREAAGVIHTELGRALVPGPAIAQMLVIEALCEANGLAERDDLLARAMSGEVMTATLCHAPDADKASYTLVSDEHRVALVPAERCAVLPVTTWDKTRRLFDVKEVFAGLILAEGDAAQSLHAQLQSQLLFAIAGDSLGGADAVLALTIDYLKTRRQFDRPLAMFQALKHRVADLKTQLVAAEALFWSRTSGEASLAQMGALKAHCTTVYRTIAEESIQLHGGIGLTQEYPCHRFLKRAMLNCALGGDADHWEEAAGRALLVSA